MFRHVLMLISFSLLRGGGARDRNRGRGGARPNTDIESPGDLVKLLDWFHGKIEDLWNPWIEQWPGNNEHQPMAKMAFVYLVPPDLGEVIETPSVVGSADFTSACEDPNGDRITIGPEDTNALYCKDDLGTGLDGTPTEGVVTIPVEPLRQVLAGDVWSTRYPLRDQEPLVRQQLLLFALNLVGHECGHGVDRAINVYSDDWAHSRELFADCISGNIMAHVEGDILAEAPELDLVEAVRTLGFAAIGDVFPPDARNDRPQARNRLYFGVHGFAEQRRQAFERGYNAGKNAPNDPPAVCLANYYEEVG
jgi:hypothetical protein